MMINSNQYEVHRYIHTHVHAHTQKSINKQLLTSFKQAQIIKLMKFKKEW